MFYKIKYEDFVIKNIKHPRSIVKDKILELLEESPKTRKELSKKKGLTNIYMINDKPEEYNKELLSENLNPAFDYSGSCGNGGSCG